MSNCPACGATITVGAAFCSACGASQAEAQAPAPGVCRSCGKTLAPGAAFCSACGASQAGQQSPALPATRQHEPPASLVYDTPAVPAAAPQWVAQPAHYAPVAAPGYAGPTPPGTLSAMAARGELRSWNGQPLSPGFAGRKVTAGVLALLLGPFGIHKFVLGYVGAGLAMLFITLASVPAIFLLGLGFIGIAVMGIISLIEGIIYLTKSDDEFIQRYGLHHKSWF